MASWKDGVGQYTWGTYLNTGTNNDIAVVGGAKGGGSDYFGISESEMDTLRTKDYGTGVHFWRDGNKLNITINLIIISIKNDAILRNGYYVGDSSADYKFFANIQYKTKQGNWVELGDKEINTFHGGDPMYDRAGWDTGGSGYLWKTFTFDSIDLSQVTQFSVGVHGEGNEIRRWNYYNIEDVLKTVTKRLTIKYLNKQTREEVRPPFTVDVLENTQYRDTAPNVNGYSIENPDINIFMVNDTEYIVWYIPHTSVTVKYLDRVTNRQLRADTRIDDLTVGQTITRTALSIPDYTPEQSQITHVVTRGTNIITFYYRQIPKVRAWAIRQGGRWKSLGTIDKHFKIRRSGTMITTPNEDIISGDVGRENYSANRIRKANSWKAQGKVGD